MRTKPKSRHWAGAALTMLAMAVAPLGAVRAQDKPAAATPLTAEAPCPAPPEALVKRRSLVGEPPPPSAEDLQAYRRYVEVQRANDWPGLCRYAADNQSLAGGTRPRIVLIGDSITEYWKSRDPAVFADGVVDRGVSGQTTPQILLRFYQDVIALRPRVVHIMAGTNDIAGNTGPMTDARFQNNIRAMVELAQAHGIKVVLASIPPAKAFYWQPEARPAGRIKAWNAWLRAYAGERGAVFVDYHAALADADGGLKAELGADGVHPSAAGYALMDPLFLSAWAQAERRR